MKIGVLIGGTGRTLKNLIDLQEQGKLYGKVECVVAHKEVPGLKYADNIPHVCEHLNVFPFIESHSIDLVILAGWIKFLEIPPAWVNRVMNIHPSLLPSFGGKGMYGHHVHDAVIASGVKISGCTVHFVDNEYDHGPIIIQKPVSVYDDDTSETLAARVFEQEKVAYRQAINMFATGSLQVNDRRVKYYAKPPLD
jgi:formyltetrahydrofolate-dependent phosphoribosylglycinamide formyltransferase